MAVSDQSSVYRGFRRGRFARRCKNKSFLSLDFTHEVRVRKRKATRTAQSHKALRSVLAHMLEPSI